MSEARRLWSVLIEALIRGSDDPRILALSFAVAAVVLGLLVALVLLVSSWRRDSGGAGTGLPRLKRRTGVSVGTVLGISVVLALSLSAAYLNHSNACGFCHEDARLSIVGESHESVACIECHREPGVLGFAAGQADLVRWIGATAAAGWEIPGPGQLADVSSRACLACHDAVLEGVLTDGLMNVRHSDFLGRPCIDCHNTVGHGEQVRLPTYPNMRICMSCHDARQAAADCDICHVGDVVYAAQRATPRAPAIKVVAPTGTDCRGCHEMSPCNSCHGLEMPHPPGWMPGHARPAFEQPGACWRCHPGPGAGEGGIFQYTMCNQCHRFPGPHGPTTEWLRRHGAAAAKEPGMIGRTRCGLCHSNQRFCDLCHEGRRERVDYR